MTAPVCYLHRADRGDRPLAVRLLSTRDDLLWNPHHTDPPPHPLDDIRSAADWVASAAHARRLAALCVDGEGSLFTWITAPGRTPAIVRAALLQRDPLQLAPDDPDPADASVQPLAEPAHNGRASLRLPALLDRDAATAVFLDRLDAKGIAPASVLTIYHALAAAWDPPPRSTDDPALLDAPPRTTAVILIDPQGRLLWAWSRAGSLCTAGSIRLRSVPQNPDDPDSPHLPVLAPDAAARLTADWLAWAAQLGTTPSRILCIAPNDHAPGHTPADFARALAAAWPDATLDLTTDDDPIGATLQRIADDAPDAPPTDPRSALVSLALRPARAHRRMVFAAACVLLALALVVLAAATRFWSATRSIRDQIQSVDQRTAAILAELDPRLASDPFALNRLDARITQRRQALDAAGSFSPPKPILAELDSIALVLDSNLDLPAWQGTMINQISLSSHVGRLEFLVPSTAVGEQLAQALRNIRSAIDWKEVRFENAPVGQQTFTRTTIIGAWSNPPD